MNYIIRIENKVLEIENLKLKGLSGLNLINEIKEYLHWLDQPAASKDPQILELGMLFEKYKLSSENFVITDLLNIVTKEEKDLILSNISKLSQINQPDYLGDINIMRAFELYKKTLIKLKHDVDSYFLNEENYDNAETIIELLRAVYEVKNNHMSNFSTPSNIENSQAMSSTQTNL